MQAGSLGTKLQKRQSQSEPAAHTPVSDNDEPQVAELDHMVPDSGTEVRP